MRKGNIMIAAIISNKAVNVNPKILNGSNKSQKMGKIKIANKANGQLITNKIHQRIKAISVRMRFRVGLSALTQNYCQLIILTN